MTAGTISRFNYDDLRHSHNILARGRGLLGVKLFDTVSIIAGPSLEYYHTFKKNQVDRPDMVYHKTQKYRENNYFWPGVYVGVQM